MHNTGNITNGASAALAAAREVPGVKTRHVDVPFTVDGWSVDAFTVEITLDVPSGPVDLVFGFSESIGWDVFRCELASTGDEVDANDLARSLGFECDDVLFAALTDGLFVTNYRSAALFTRPAVTA